MIYFQSADKTIDQETSKIETKYTHKVQKGDILSITVSSLNNEANEMFNPFSNQNLRTTSQSVGTISPQPIIGFLVDSNGFITIPLLGNIQVTGYTTHDLSSLLTVQLEKYLKAPTVNIRIANYRITILGEVARPAIYTVPNEVITLPEALALAGDINVFGKRKKILIIRETEGNREFARVDITKRDIFNSPYYYLHSGDIVYIEPTSGRATSTDRLYQLTPVVISSLTFMILIFNTFNR